MTQSWESLDQRPLEKLSALQDESRDVIVISTSFDPGSKQVPATPQNYQLTDNSVRILSECVRALKFGGLLFIYGTPHDLAFWGEHTSNASSSKTRMVFKYWITLDIDDAPRGETLQPTGLGLLMFLKSKADKRTPESFHLNTDLVRTPHAYCSACGQNVKDWGGKKHLMNPRGTALSDVWRFSTRTQVQDSIVPDFVLNRVSDLTARDGQSRLHVVQDEAGVCADLADTFPPEPLLNWPPDAWADMTRLELNRVYEGESISFLSRVSELNPQGVFDLAFADPPYNLGKSYDSYEDALADQHYIHWCNRWLEGMVRTLRPGGSLFVLNLPKWAVHHAAYLNRRMEFRHWITWDALSDPRGKIMPAHYSLLYYTKPGAPPVFNYAALGEAGNPEKVLPPDAPKYCLRASCIKRRKRLGDDEKIELTDVWSDIHRIKHKRDRDDHPCQLPEKLLERIILLTTNRGGVVFDPFCGAGTTAIAASKMGRDFVSVDLDPSYVRIAREKLSAMKQQVAMFGVACVPRRTFKRAKTAATKKEIEIYLQRLAQRLGKEPSEEDIEADNADMLQKIDLMYPTRLAAIKRSRIALR